jgi:CBS-domain-containing membrane protein
LTDIDPAQPTAAPAPPVAQRAAVFPALRRETVREAVLAGIGGAVAIGVLSALAVASATPLIIPPFGASAVILFLLPSSPVAQPRHVIGGHILSAIVGLVALTLFGPTALAMAVGVGVAIVAMKLTDTLHPPAGANPLLVVMTSAPWWFVGVPVAAGAVILVLIAVGYHRYATGKAYPADGR